MPVSSLPWPPLWRLKHTWLGLRTSALRYYDERGLVAPAARVAGRRMYGPAELRRTAFLTLAQRLGIPLATAAAVLDAPGRTGVPSPASRSAHSTG